jgi:putative aminopeptidase FrvX
MKRTLLLAWFLLLATTSPAQTLQENLQKFVETPAVTGYEQALAAEIKARLKNLSPQTDNMGNVWVTLGEGAPSRLIVAPLDEPGYVVSGITEDGYLRVQRLPQTAPHGVFDLLHTAQPVLIRTRGGKWVPGVVAGLSTHLQGGRRGGPRVDHPDEIYVDIGASSADEVRQAGVDLLDPIALERRLYAMGFGRMTGVAVGDRFGAAALVDLLGRIDRTKVRGTLTVAFVAQQWASSRGLDRLMRHVKADEMLYVGRLLPRRGGLGPAAAAGEARAARLEPGSGALIGSTSAGGSGEAALTGLAAELKRLAEENKIPVAVDFSAPLPTVSYTRGPVLPERFAHVSVATAWPATPAEFIHFNDLQNLEALLETYLTGASAAARAEGTGAGISLAAPSLPAQPKAAPTTTEVLRHLTEAYGMSGKEAAARETIARLLPPWAKPETDQAGNLILRVATASAGSKAPRIVFVAHSDEIGYSVESIAADGRLVVRSVGGGITEFFSGHAMFVHTANGIRPGVMELPQGWDRPNFEWPRGPQAGPLRVDAGARTPAEVEQLGIKAGDWVTVPKKYRPLAGKRATARSFDNRAGCTALVLAAWALGPNLKDRDITFVWATEEEVGLRGARAFADRMAEEGRGVDYVFAVDTFVSADSPLESKRFADAVIGKGFAIRAVDNSTIAPPEGVQRVIEVAGANRIPVQYGVTSGGNDGATFLRHGAVNIPIGWALRYSHSPGEVIDTRDVDALAAIIAAIARSW